MPTVDTSRLKGNFGAAYVSAMLSSECLVRPVAGDTDVGVDLYCETIEDGAPFLHFWVQVKAGTQCRVSADGRSASCSFDVHHLNYWSRQPVPVFAALVPVDWPVSENPRVYVIDLTLHLLDGIPNDARTVSLSSDGIWRPNGRDDVKRFLSVDVPTSTARLQCKGGVVGRIPTIRPSYEYEVPTVPVASFKKEILNRIRTTAAFSIVFLHERGELNLDSSFRKRLASVVAQFDDDPHWENAMARALSYHADEQFELAAEAYNRAKQLIEDDPNVAHLPAWQRTIEEISQLCEKAREQERL